MSKKKNKISKEENGYNYSDIDYDQLKKKQKSLNTGGFYLKASKLPEGESDFRLLPPHVNQEGIYYLELHGYWINSKFYVSPKTFNLDCPIEEIVAEAIKTEDDDIAALLNSSNYRPIKNYLIPGLLLDIKYNKKDEVKGYKVVDDCIKILQCGSQLFKAINRIVVSRAYNKHKGGIFHPKTGYNIFINKAGSGKETEYSSTGCLEPMEIETKWLKDLPDLKALTRKRMLSNKELKEAINDYLYGNVKKKKKKKKSIKDTLPM